VLLVAKDGPEERSVLRILREREVFVEWAQSAAELEKRAASAELLAPEVVFLDLDLDLGSRSEERSVSLVRRRFGRAAVVAFCRTLSGERAARLLGVGVAVLPKPVSPSVLAELAMQLCALRTRDAAPSGAGAKTAREWSSALQTALDTYAEQRGLSRQQKLILGLYLCGENDKQIADAISCSESTVYEHWRRIARKAGGSSKADAITDFHRFLVRN
jgi:DNA-binding NarL/FixJ family response regulator